VHYLIKNRSFNKPKRDMECGQYWEKKKNTVPMGETWKLGE